MYVSIDLETGGLYKEEADILQIAMVKWDHEDIMKCSHIDMVIKRPSYQVSAFAANMNRDLFEVLAKDEDPRIVSVDDSYELFHSFLRSDEKHYALGKNAGTFDLPFLEQHDYGWEGYFKHRVLDVGCLYATAAGIPSLSDILEYVPLPEALQECGSLHHALWDARVTLYLAQRALDGLILG